MMREPCADPSHRRLPPHGHPNLGIEDVPEDLLVIYLSNPTSVVCTKHSIGFDISRNQNRLLQHLGTHLGWKEVPEPAKPLAPPTFVPRSPPKQRAEVGSEMPKKKSGKKSETKTERKPTKEATEEKAPRARTRVYETRVDKEGNPAVWLNFSKADQPRIMDRKVLGSSLGEFAREAWKSRPPKELPQVPPAKPTVSRLVFFPKADAKEIVEYEASGGDFDAYINSRIQRKIAA